ncbi:type II toxin-antitoxin system RelE/ParE family toxin [Thalassospira mesophila]|uniref:Toxin n=1 Tax=Thalassospira mesophila TaxID=1293891 RepID=A0A1Y2KVE1_9PROT|nr:type II toxin-antitoxin system RelE/ParE family toxin [Thalassospira mesophila]OSQ35751.1 hypothetical protein TMES_20230 [Thalassospira mesophila]
MSGFSVSKAAYADIRGIASNTQKTWGIERRRRYLDGLNEKFEVLARMPEMSHERQDFVPPVRISHYEKHLIIYAHHGDGGILIIRVLHQNMDVTSQLSS